MEGGDARPVEAAAGGIEEGIPPVAEPSMVSGDRATERQSERARARESAPVPTLAARVARRPPRADCLRRSRSRTQPSNYKAYLMVDYYAPAFDSFAAYTREGEQQLVQWYQGREKRHLRSSEPMVIETYNEAAMVAYYR